MLDANDRVVEMNLASGEQNATLSRVAMRAAIQQDAEWALDKTE